MIFMMFLNITFLINVEEPPLPRFMSAAISAIELYCPEKRFFLNFFSSALKVVFVGGGGGRGSHQHIWSLYQSVIVNQTNRRSTFFSLVSRSGGVAPGRVSVFFRFFFDLPFLIFSI